MNEHSDRTLHPPLRILHHCPVWLPQTQTWLYNQIHALPAGVENHVSCLRIENRDQFPHDDLHEMCDSVLAYRLEALLRKLNFALQPHWLTRLGKKLRPHVLHSHFGNMGWLNLKTARQLGIPHVVTFYGLDVDFLPQQNPHWHERYRELFARADLFLCEGPHMATRLIARGCPPAKIKVHHLGVDIGGIAFHPRSRKPGEPLRVLIAGAFREKKGIPYALQALGMVRKQIPLEITLVGDADGELRSQEERRHILSIISQYGLDSCIRLLGFQPAVRLMREAYNHHVFLSPSVHAGDGDNEGGAPVSIIEMQASGMPIISTTHCDIPEVVCMENHSMLVPERDADALAERLLWLAENPNHWIRLAEAGRVHVETQFDMMRQGARLQAIYQELATS